MTASPTPDSPPNQRTRGSGDDRQPHQYDRGTLHFRVGGVQSSQEGAREQISSAGSDLGHDYYHRTSSSGVWRERHREHEHMQRMEQKDPHEGSYFRGDRDGHLRIRSDDPSLVSHSRDQMERREGRQGYNTRSKYKEPDEFYGRQSRRSPSDGSISPELVGPTSDELQRFHRLHGSPPTHQEHHSQTEQYASGSTFVGPFVPHTHYQGSALQQGERNFPTIQEDEHLPDSSQITRYQTGVRSGPGQHETQHSLQVDRPQSQKSSSPAINLDPLDHRYGDQQQKQHQDDRAQLHPLQQRRKHELHQAKTSLSPDHSHFGGPKHSAEAIPSSSSFSSAVPSYSSSQQPEKHQRQSHPLQQYQHGPLPVASFESHHSSHTSGTSHSSSVGGADPMIVESHQPTPYPPAYPQYSHPSHYHHYQPQKVEEGYSHPYTSHRPPHSLPPPPPPPPYTYSSYYYYPPDHPYHQYPHSGSGPYQTQPHGPFVHHLNNNDVLCGRGGATNSHIGNRAFREIVKQHQDRYLRAKKKEKPEVASEIVDMIRNLDPPGRFLRKDKASGWWMDIGDVRAREKTSQALREGAPELRRKKEEQTASRTSSGDSGDMPAVEGSHSGASSVETSKSAEEARRVEEKVRNWRRALADDDDDDDDHDDSDDDDDDNDDNEKGDNKEEKVKGKTVSTKEDNKEEIKRNNQSPKSKSLEESAGKAKDSRHSSDSPKPKSFEVPPEKKEGAQEHVDKCAPAHPSSGGNEKGDTDSCGTDSEKKEPVFETPEEEEDAKKEDVTVPSSPPTLPAKSGEGNEEEGDDSSHQTPISPKSESSNDGGSTESSGSGSQGKKKKRRKPPVTVIRPALALTKRKLAAVALDDLSEQDRDMYLTDFVPPRPTDLSDSPREENEEDDGSPRGKKSARVYPV